MKLHFFLSAFVLIAAFGCSKEDKYKDYTGIGFNFEIDSIYNVTQTSATIKATLHTIAYRGDISDLQLYLGTAEDIYSAIYRVISSNSKQGTVVFNVSNLEPNTLYYITPCVKFGNMTTSDPKTEVSMMTHGERPATGTVSDIDGNIYHYITIGAQTWMVENLKTTHLRSGLAIDHIVNDSAWDKNTYLAYCDYNYDASNGAKYGHLYSAEVAASFIAPPGWHVPTLSDWRTLENYLIKNGYNATNSTTDNVIAKSLASKTDWSTSMIYSNGPNIQISNDASLNNSSGFTALPGGMKSQWGFEGITNNASFWTSDLHMQYKTQFFPFQYVFQLWYYSENSILQQVESNEGYYIRCIRDN